VVFPVQRLAVVVEEDGRRHREALPYFQGTAPPQRSRKVVSDVGRRLLGPKDPCGYPSGTQNWKGASLGMLSRVFTGSIPLACSVVGTEPIPSARAASIRFCTAGITELAPPWDTLKASTTHGASCRSSASRG